MKKISSGLIITVLFFAQISYAQENSYPQNYFRGPLNIPMQLVANFGEIRANHWHMGLDIRTQHRVNLPVHAAADGYIARVSVEPGGFGQAIYINHPNGFTTVYGHLNAFFPALAKYVKDQQYQQQTWKINLEFSPDQFPVNKGDLIALSGSTGASEGPHVHFEIRDTKTEKCLNPLLFNFPVADAVPPSLLRLAVYDRNKSTYAQSPQILALKKTGGVYKLASTNILRVGSDKISFAVGAVDRLSNSANPNGIYSARVSVDGTPVSEFVLNNIGYDETRYINAQIDYPYKARGGSYVQHISPLPGATTVAYNLFGSDGMIYLNNATLSEGKDKAGPYTGATINLHDADSHSVVIEVKDPRGNTSRLEFRLEYDASLAKPYVATTSDKLIPNNVNVFERDGFELYTTEQSIYDTIAVSYTTAENNASNAVSSLHSFLSAAIPSHDSITVRIKPIVSVPENLQDRIVIKNVCGEKTFVEKAEWQKGWLAAKFRQFGTFQAFIDNEPPTVNTPPTNLSKTGRIVFVPEDNFHTIKSFRAELDGQWLRFTNDKGHAWVYYPDEHFPAGEHQLKVTIEDEAGNVTTKVWSVKR